jgi:SAM-dependent methyltransferase
MAEGYDDSFTHSALGQLLRQAVWARLDAAFAPGERVLELSCGTGEDAIHLARRGVRVLATDVSTSMLAVAQAKVTCAGLKELVTVQHLDIASLSTQHSALSTLPRARRTQHSALSTQHSPFDGAFSNFGGLNCVADQAVVAAGLARRLRPGGVAWRGLRISYPSIGTLRSAYAPWFRCRRVSAVGALLPPSYAELWARARPRLLWALHRIERRFEAAPPLPWLADHYLIELERK